MGTIHSKAKNDSISVDRLIGQVNGMEPGPTIIFTGGIHGNEPSGVFALKEVLDIGNSKKEKLNGSIYAITGNLWALEREVRYDKQDLNRLWTKNRMQKILAGKENELETNEDAVQQLEIHQLILDILEKEEGPFFFIDLHTTSGDTMPFLTVNDTLLNRKFSLQFPVPIILGIEEFLEGPLLSYINYLGYVAVGFESGQHDALSSIDNHIAFSMMSIVIAGCLSQADFPEYDSYCNQLSSETKGVHNIFEIIHRHEIGSEDSFEMKPGFQNFQSLPKGTVVAINNDQELASPKKGKIFMPLYQKQGNDGYFVVRKTPYFFLKFSAFLRKIRFDKVLVLLPGVRWANKKEKTLIIKLSVARFFAKEFLHLLGYRSRQMDDKNMYAKNREVSSLNDDYKDVKWMR
jgi:Succinylglutamate desuccinylase / Aspartoacylase family